MLRYRRRALIALSILVLGAAVTGGVVAASQSSDEQALQPAAGSVYAQFRPAKKGRSGTFTWYRSRSG